MALKRTLNYTNGDQSFQYNVYECDDCFVEIEEAWPRLEDVAKDIHYCLECSFKRGLIEDNEFLQFSGIVLKSAKVRIDDNGKIEIYTGWGRAPWERNERQQRGSDEYKQWRKGVFKRDDYTCQKCGQVGGELNAHHIKPFKDFPKLRTVLENGVTLCVKCHKKEHKKD